MKITRPFNIYFSYVDLNELKNLEIINTLLLSFAWGQRDVFDYIIYEKMKCEKNDFNQIKFFWLSLMKELIFSKTNLNRDISEIFKNHPRWYEYAGDDKCSPFLIATLFGNIHIMEQMLKNYPKCRYDRDEEGNTALLLASWFASKNVIAWLLENNFACAKECSDNGHTSLMYASTKNNREVIELLLNHGANINATDCKGRTALHYAIFVENPDVAEVLIFDPEINTTHFNKIKKSICESRNTFLNSEAIEKIIKFLQKRLLYPNRVNYRMIPRHLIKDTIFDRKSKENLAENQAWSINFNI